MTEKARRTALVAVCGAHMSGLPLNWQLLDLGGKLVSRTTTASLYRLYSLMSFDPPRPGLVRVPAEGSRIEVEVWSLPLENYGAFVSGIPSPLGIGTLQLADGTSVQGFLCENYAIGQAFDITAYGSWRNYITSPA